MVTGVIDFKDRDEGDGFCFKMQVELNYDFLEVYQETK